MSRIVVFKSMKRRFIREKPLPKHVCSIAVPVTKAYPFFGPPPSPFILCSTRKT